MCFNFHFLLLENTDGDSLPLTHTEQGADWESGARQTRAAPPAPGEPEPAAQSGSCSGPPFPQCGLSGMKSGFVMAIFEMVKPLTVFSRSGL